jgi:hypothetical protein
MSRYRVDAGIVLDDTNKSASFNTNTIDLSDHTRGSIAVNVTTSGGVSWTVVVQGSNDDITFVDTRTPTALIGTENYIFSISDLTSRYYRVAFTRTSGTLSTVKVTFNAKR